MTEGEVCQKAGKNQGNYFAVSSGFSFLPLRGCGGVVSILCNTLSNAGVALFRLRGFFSVSAIGKPSENQTIPVQMIGQDRGKDKSEILSDDPRLEPLLSWLAQFLNYWEDEPMLYDRAAKIILDQILNFLSHMQQPENEQPIRLPEPDTFFHTE